MSGCSRRAAAAFQAGCHLRVGRNTLPCAVPGCDATKARHCHPHLPLPTGGAHEQQGAHRPGAESLAIRLVWRQPVHHRAGALRAGGCAFCALGFAWHGRQLLGWGRLLSGHHAMHSRLNGGRLPRLCRSAGGAAPQRDGRRVQHAHGQVRLRSCHCLHAVCAATLNSSVGCSTGIRNNTHALLPISRAGRGPSSSAACSRWCTPA